MVFPDIHLLPVACSLGIGSPVDDGPTPSTWMIRFNVVTINIGDRLRPGEAQGHSDSRGLDMARSNEVFAGATLTVEDDRQDYGEDRFITNGLLDERMVILVWTRRDDSHRIINVRKANERERALYSARLGSGRRTGPFR